MGQMIDLTGQRFGRLVVIRRADNNSRGDAMWDCLCDCGKHITTRGNSLRSGHTQSCGCYHCDKASTTATKHGMVNTRLYNIWMDMRKRCYDRNYESYHWYGERGISVCNEWRTDFKCFYDWAMAHSYKDNLSIDRIDVNENYEPSNCRWVTHSEQMRNTRRNNNITFNGETHCMTDWAIILGISRSTLHHRLVRGWNIDRALTEKVGTSIGNNQFKKRV